MSHPILVNFTAALLPLAFLSDVLGLIFRRRSLHLAAAWMVLYEALLTPVTVAAVGGGNTNPVPTYPTG